MAFTVGTSSRKNDTWGEDVASRVFAESAVDGSGFRIPPDMRLVQVTSMTTINAANITPQYSMDEGTTWLDIDVDIEGRSYPEAVAGSARAKLPKTFLLPGGALFRLYSSASQTSKTWTGRVGK